jgi:hypothetical protein
MTRIDSQTFKEKCLTVSFAVVLFVHQNNVWAAVISSAAHVSILGQKRMRIIENI